MIAFRNILVVAGLTVLVLSCKNVTPEKEDPKMQNPITAKDILGNPDYLAISYGGYRMKSRDSQPTLKELKEDLRILHAMNIRVLRTYNVQLPHASNVLKAIREIKTEDPSFEMYVMLGAWIDCLNAWTDLEPDHNVESPNNEAEIGRAVALANEYPEIVKILAVGNEAMVNWATSYYVQPEVILKWVTYLQDLKKAGELPAELWITSSDDFASWGGGDESYHTEDLEKLMRAVDYISMHTYPYHNSHYNPEFWLVPGEQKSLTKLEKIDSAMTRALRFSVDQYNAVSAHMKSLGIDKPIHIGETGWATTSNGFYGADGSRATDQYKQALFYNYMREWTNANGISCFYFEAFDEPWKDAQNNLGSENHFGLFTVDGKAKYPLWNMVDQGVFEGLTRGGNPITKTYDGNKEDPLLEVFPPPSQALTPAN